MREKRFPTPSLSGSAMTTNHSSGPEGNPLQSPGLDKAWLKFEVYGLPANGRCQILPCHVTPSAKSFHFVASEIVSVSFISPSNADLVDNCPDGSSPLGRDKRNPGSLVFQQCRRCYFVLLIAKVRNQVGIKGFSVEQRGIVQTR